MLVIGKDEDGIVTLSGLAAAVRTSTSNLQDPLRSLVATGLLSPIESGDSRSKFYVRNPSPAWDWAVDLSLQALNSSSTGSENDSTSAQQKASGATSAGNT